MKFDQIGYRNLQISDIQSHTIEDANKTYCPSCKAGPMDGVTGASFTEEDSFEEGHKVFPKDGDPTICAYCCELLEFRFSPDVVSLSYPRENTLINWKKDSQQWMLIPSLQKSMLEKKNKKNEKPRF